VHVIGSTEPVQMPIKHGLVDEAGVDYRGDPRDVGYGRGLISSASAWGPRHCA
jgi:hypothetical protein